MRRFVFAFLATSASASAPVPQCDAMLPREFDLSEVQTQALRYCCYRLEPSLRLTKADEAAKARAWDICTGTYMRRAGQ